MPDYMPMTTTTTRAATTRDMATIGTIVRTAITTDTTAGTDSVHPVGTTRVHFVTIGTDTNRRGDPTFANKRGRISNYNILKPLVIAVSGTVHCRSA